MIKDNPTLADVIQSMDPNGSTAKLVELLSQKNQILEDMTWLESNQATGHVSVIRTGLPDVTWRKLYQGVAPSKSTRAKITDTIGILEKYAEVDKDLADLNGNTAQFRLSEDKAFIEAMSQEMARALIYEDERNLPEALTGLSPRFNSLAAANASLASTTLSRPSRL